MDGVTSEVFGRRLDLVMLSFLTPDLCTNTKLGLNLEPWTANVLHVSLLRQCTEKQSWDIIKATSQFRVSQHKYAHSCISSVTPRLINVPACRPSRKDTL